jgi:hypothetical protein
MKALMIVAGLFFSVFAGALAFYSMTGAGHEYDLKFALPIDTRKMPKLGPPPEIVSQAPGASGKPVIDGRAEAGKPPLPAGYPVQFPDRDNTASEHPIR